MSPRLESELAVFWDEIAKHLPKSIERSALGDEKIFRALRAAYPTIRKHIWNAALDAVREGVPMEFETEDLMNDLLHPVYAHRKGWNDCRTAVTDHINSLGIKQ